MPKASSQVFISAGASDGAWARDLSDRLQKTGVDTWVSSRVVLPGANLSREVGEALDRADAMVVLVSPDGMKSAWVRREILFALGEQRFEGRLIPVLIKRTSSEEIPWTFGALQWAKGSPAQVARQVTRMLRGRGWRKPRVRRARQASVRKAPARAEAG